MKYLSLIGFRMLLLLGLGASLSPGNTLHIEPEQPARGDPVTMVWENLPGGLSLAGTVRDPLGKMHRLEFQESGSGSYRAHFDQTHAAAFLREDWGAYQVRASASDPESTETWAAEHTFQLDPLSKTLYAVLWIDDFGTGGELSSAFISWYHEQAGPISYVLQQDDTRSFNLDRLLAGYDFNQDYLGHHLQSMRWGGARWRLTLNRWTYGPYERARQRLNQQVGFQLVRAIYLLAILVLLAACGGWIYIRHRRRKALWLAGAALLLALLLLALRANFVMLDDWRNWTFEIANRAWRLETLDQAREEFASQGMDFPPVVRHAWNLPPADSMDDYMQRYGVLADASAVRGMGTNAYLRIAFGIHDREIVWSDRVLPYYASRSQDYNAPWDGQEEDRGLLELPLTFHGAARLAWDRSCEDIVAGLPHGALTAVYIHPGESVETVKQWVTYLNKNVSGVEFVRIDEYMQLFMHHHPRPVHVDAQGTASWAFLNDARLIPIRETDQVRVSTGDTPGEPWELDVHTRAPIPVLSLPVPPNIRYVSMGDSEYPLSTDDSGGPGRVHLRDLPPGKHRVEFLPASPSARTESASSPKEQP